MIHSARPSAQPSQPVRNTTGFGPLCGPLCGPCPTLLLEGVRALWGWRPGALGAWALRAGWVVALALVEGEGGAVSPAAICESVSEGKAYSSGGRREYPLPAASKGVRSRLRAGAW
eukprot:1161230-Pelagomonas_calceolata.AAC.11